MQLQSSATQEDDGVAMVEGSPAVALRQAVVHEVPRLSASADIPLVAEPGDAAALLRIVEEQAHDLMVLRRALRAAHRIAAQRLQTIRAAPSVVAEQPPTPPHDALSEREEVVAELSDNIFRVQEDIRLITERSRWRRLGQALGLAKRLSWEVGEWRSKFLPPSGAPSTSHEKVREEPMPSELRAELRRMIGLREELGRSRWRQLGQRMGVANRMAWEAAASVPTTLGTVSVATVAAPESAVPSMATLPVPSGPSASSYEGFLEHTSRRFLEECRGFATDVVLDVGANIGQFAKGLRTHGYDGQIVSFEPLSDAHEALVVAAKDDLLWDVVERCAVGAANGTAEINIAGNSASSSLLPMLDRHRDAAPHSAYGGSERCLVLTLDTFIDRTFVDPTTLFGLKIDTQGYEAEVLAGLVRNRERVKVILCEMSLAPLYGGGPTMPELCSLLAELGYRCVALGPEFEDPRTGELLQADGVFVRRE